MPNPIKTLSEAIQSGILHQEIKAKVVNLPVIHFSRHSEAIISQGFIFGEREVHELDLTHNEGVPRHHVGPGYNFAFNAMAWDFENDCYDYEVATDAVGRNLMGMMSDTAVLLQASGLYTRHADDFHQVVFWGPDANTDRAILLRNVGSVEIDGEMACDDNGNEVDCWTATAADGTSIIEAEHLLTLRECVLMSLIHLDKERQISPDQSEAYRALYAGEIESLDVSDQLPIARQRPSKEHFDGSFEP